MKHQDPLLWETLGVKMLFIRYLIYLVNVFYVVASIAASNYVPDIRFLILLASLILTVIIAGEWLRRRIPLQMLHLILIPFDLSIITLSISLTGGIMSDSYLIYLIETFLVALYMGHRPAVSVAWLSMLLYGMVVFPDLKTEQQFWFLMFRIVMILLFTIGIGFLGQYLRKQQLKLEENEQRYKSLFEHNPDAIYSLDLKGNITSANRGAEKVTGYTADEIVNVPVRFFLRPDDYARAKEHYQRVIRGEPQNYEIAILHKNGKFVDLHVTHVPIVVNDEVVGVYGISKDITDQKEAEQIIHHMAYHDPLTNLPNRRSFQNRLQETLAAAFQANYMAAVLFLDLDGFKLINDSLGHDAGDLLLQTVAVRLESCVEEGDVVARMGGDEFTILLPRILNTSEPVDMSKKVLKSIEQPIHLMGQKIRITASIGIAIYPDDGIDAGNLMKKVDMAMYRAKERGKNSFQFSSDN